jgi:hypothetical protein
MNNESAFPTSFSPDYPREIIGGMTLRDYFAAKAMQAILSNYGFELENASLANSAYILADAMMKARAKE